MDKNLEIKFKITPELNQPALDDISKQIAKASGIVNAKVEVDDSEIKDVESKISSADSTINAKVDVDDSGVEDVESKISTIDSTINAKVDVDDSSIDDVGAKISSVDTTINAKVDFDDSDAKDASKTFDNISDSVEDLSDNLKASNNAIDDLGAGAERTGGKFEFVNKLATFGLVAGGINALSDSLNQISEPFLKLDTATQAMRTLGPEAQELSGQLRDMALSLSTELPFAAGEFQEAMGNAMASGVQGGADALAGFAETAAKLATGGGAELGAVVQGLGATLNAFGATAEDAGQYADWMFNIVNAGVTTIDELNQYLSGVTPTAAAMGLSFDKLGGSLALMTQKGVPTASAVTKLNALLIEMAKPTAGITEALGKAGVSLEDFHQMIKDDNLTGALQTLQDGFTKAGKTATQAFSSSEAGAAFNVLMGDVGLLNDTLDAVSNTSGSTQAAYDEMAQSIEVRTKQMKAQFDTFMISILDSTGGFGAFASMAASSFASIAPSITALSGLAAVMPTKAIGELGAKMAKTLIPSLIATNASTGALTLNMNALRASQLKNTVVDAASAVARLGVAAATTVATVAQTAFNAAMNANPIMLAVAGVAALAGGLYLLADALTESTAEKAESLKKEDELVKKQMESNKAQQDKVKGQQDLLKSYEELGAKTERTAAEEERFRNVQLELSKAYPGLISSTADFAENLERVKSKSESSRGELENLKAKYEELEDKRIELKIQMKANDAQGTVDEMNDIVSSFWGDDRAAAAGIDKFVKAMKGASSKADLESIGHDFKMAIMNGKEFANMSNEDKEKMVKLAENLEGSLSEGLSAKGEKAKDAVSELIDKAMAGSKISPDALRSISETTGVPLAEIERMFNEAKVVAQNNKMSDILKDSLKVGDAGDYSKVNKGIEELAQAMQITNEQAKEMVLKKAFEDAEKAGTLTADKAKDIGKNLNVTEGKAMELYQAQKLNTAEAKQTAAASGDIVKNYTDAMKALNERYSGAKTELATIRSLEANGVGLTNEQVKRKKELIGILNETTSQIKKENAITADIDKRWSTTVEKSQKVQKSILEGYNLEKDRLNVSLQNLETEREQKRIREGLSKTIEDDLQSQRDKLLVLKQQKGYLENLKLISGLSADAKKDIEKELTALVKEINTTGNQIDTLAIKAEVESVNLKEASKKLQLEADKRKLQFSFDIGEINLGEFNTKILEIARQELAMLNDDMSELNEAFVKADPINQQTIQKNINSLADAIDKKSLEVSDYEGKLFTALQIRKIRETYSGAEAQKRIELLLLDEEYQAKIDKAAFNEGEINSIVEEARQKRLDILKKYNDLDSKNTFESVGEAMTGAMKGIDFSFFGKNTDMLDDQMKKLDDSVSSLDEQYKKGEIAYSDYITRLNEIDNERTDALKEANDTQKELWDAFNSSITESFSAMASEAAGSLSKDLETMTKNGVDAYTQLQETVGDTTSIFIAQSIAMAAESGKLWKSMTIGLFEAVKAQVAALSALILGKELAKKSVFGIPIAAMLSGLLYGALSAAEAAVKAAKFEHGGLVTGGEQLIRINEVGDEFVMNHVATMKNLGAFEEINKRNITVEQFARERYLTYPEKPAIDNKQINMRFKGLERRIEMTNMKLDKLGKLDAIERISAQTRDAVHSSRTRIHNDVEIHVDDKELITRAEVTRRKLVRSR